jgi:hypothetical protein
MHKTIVLAFAIAVLAVVTLITDVVRADARLITAGKLAGAVVQQIQTAGNSGVN